MSEDILQQGYEDRKVTCPHCSSKNCFESTELATKMVSWLCLKCGYTSNTYFTEDSQQLKESFGSAPTLIQELQFKDEERKIIWIPCVLNMGKRGIIYPRGSRNNWNWEYAKVVDIPIDEQKKYPVPGKENVFYQTKLDIDNSMKFEWDDFIGACEEMGITSDIVTKGSFNND